jgi:hypothetical protein
MSNFYQGKEQNELWQKHPKDPMNVQIWIMENLNSIFYYVEHAPMELNLPSQDDAPFTLGIQTPWQTKMMTKFGHKNLISFDATFGTNQSSVHFIHYFVYKLSFI